MGVAAAMAMAAGGCQTAPSLDGGMASQDAAAMQVDATASPSSASKRLALAAAIHTAVPPVAMPRPLTPVTPASALEGDGAGTVAPASTTASPVRFAAPLTVLPQEPASMSDAIASPSLAVETGGLQETSADRWQTGFPIDLPTALGLVEAQNPQVALARAQIREAYSRVLAAEALWLPTIQAGVSYHRHEGMLQDSSGRVIDVSRTSINPGFGTGAVGAGPILYPGLQMQFHMVDAIFQPEIARRAAAARRYAATTVQQDLLLQAALAYLDLLSAEQLAVIARDTLQRSDQLAELTISFAETGQGLRADADRAATERALRQNELARSEERVQTASARLAQVLSLDPQTQLEPQEPGVIPLELAPVEMSTGQLVATGLAARPELAENRQLVCEAIERLRREQYAPAVPNVVMGMSYGGFGGGVGDTIENFQDRTNFDAAAVWQVRNFGLGERAARGGAQARLDQARAAQLRILDQVASEIVQADAQVRARRRQIAIARQSIQTATDSYERNLTRIREGQGLPIEVLQAIQALDAARRDYLTAVIDFNEAQFRLQRAVGWGSMGQPLG